ncbi:hypothetical protein DENSPDRAFT_842164 [Dentipellis sp. KUC8613]|nr:hypothetical protein DENSPDRAFT_842164 [Dentipellis sp. KUC8613]
MPLKFLTFYQRGPRNLNVLVESHRMGNVSLAKSHSLFIDWSEGFHSPVTFIEIMIITAPRNLFLSLDRIVFLQIDWDEVFSPLGFTHMLLFSELGNLTAIQISLMYFASFVEALGTKSQLSIHANRPLPPTEYKERSVYCLPSLQVISVVTSPIPEYHGSEFVRRVLEQAKPPSHLPALLLNVLTERRERGMYMHTIEFLPALCDPSPDPNIWYEFLKPAMEGIVHLVGPDSEKYICGTDTKLPSTKYAGCSFGAFTL